MHVDRALGMVGFKCCGPICKFWPKPAMASPHGEEIRIITAAEVCYLRADRKYTSVATRTGTFLLSTSLKQLKERLDPDVFWQIHRGVIVNVSAIETIYRSYRGSLEVKLKERAEILPVSVSYARQFKSL